MKQKDITLIAVIAIIAGALSFFVSRTLFASSKNLQTEVEIVQEINPEFSYDNPDFKKYINKDSHNPTGLIRVKPNANENPFSGGN